MKVLVVGGGGREHALCRALSADPVVGALYAAPGNAGIGDIATLVPIAASDVGAIADFAELERVDLTVVGPEAPLVAGVVDELASRGLMAFGPTRDAARIEGSKVWARGLCERHGIPSPRSRVFTDLEPALRHVAGMDPPYVVKADGLAAGKGVAVSEDRASAERMLIECLVRGSFGAAGESVLVEEYLEGIEVSALALTDGRQVVGLELAHDYKRALDGDNGPNTGGMGCFSPLPFVDRSTVEEIHDILGMTVSALGEEGIAYTGVLYAGLMLTAGGPKVLEFNCRFGDPETQVLVPRLASSLGEALLACASGDLAGSSADLAGGGFRWKPETCVGVVLASRGYPASVESGKPISGLDRLKDREDVSVFHGATMNRGDKVVTSGGRVMTVSALGRDVDDARRRAYEACSLVDFDGMTYRRDIAASVAQRVA